jgi:hypothetical protein
MRVAPPPAHTHTHAHTDTPPAPTPTPAVRHNPPPPHHHSLYHTPTRPPTADRERGLLLALGSGALFRSSTAAFNLQAHSSTTLTAIMADSVGSAVGGRRRPSPGAGGDPGQDGVADGAGAGAGVGAGAPGPPPAPGDPLRLARVVLSAMDVMCPAQSAVQGVAALRAFEGASAWLGAPTVPAGPTKLQHVPLPSPPPSTSRCPHPTPSPPLAHVRPGL